VTDPDHTTYATSEAEADDRWRQRIKYELMARKADDEAIEEARKNISRRYQNFKRRRHQTDGEELLEMYLTAITSSYDPHTTYMSRDTLENFHINMRLNLEGIGAALQVKDGYTQVTKIIPGGAADKAGQLKPEDRIVSVGQGEDGEMLDVLDMKLSDVVKLIRGKAGTVVRLGVIPAAAKEKQIYQITRAKIELKDSEARAEVLEESAGPDGRKWKIGVIDLPSFYMDMAGARSNYANYKSTTEDVKRILQDFRRQKVDAVVLDLRRNGGGSLTEAINLTGLFIDEGPVVQVKDYAGRIQQYDDPESDMEWEGPLVVLTSKFSASASEILAGAIQDYRRGIVVGDKATHGKGTVQSLLDLGRQLALLGTRPSQLGALKITMQQFYLPDGKSTQERGVLADVALPSLTSHMDIGESDLDYALQFGEVPSALQEQDRMTLINDDLLSKLRKRSADRQAQSADFQKLTENIRRYLEQKQRTSVTLNEQKYLAERQEWDSEKEEEEEIENQFDTDRPVFDRESFYNQEVMAITSDYLELLQNNEVVQTDKTKIGQTGS
jgi:carboxyl-terminal processing protease